MITRVPVVGSGGVLDRHDWNGSSTWGNPNGGVFAKAPGKMVQLPQGTVAIAIDPALTTPNSIVGICRDDSGKFVYLRPGEGITFDAPTDRCYVVNPHLAQFSRTVDVVGGGCALSSAYGIIVLQACSSAADLLVYRANRNRPLPVAQMIAFGTASGLTAIPIGAENPNLSLCFSVSGLEKIRVKCDIMGAGVLIPPPADMAGVLRVYTRGKLGAAVGAQTPAVSRNQFPDLDQMSYSNTDGIVGAWAVDGSKDMTLTQFKTEFDLDVNSGGDCWYLQVATAIGGTGVVIAYVSVYGG